MKRHPAAGLDPHQQRCAQLLRDNSRRLPLHTVFADFCALAALSISNAVDRSQFATREARYLDIIKRYEREEGERFPQMLACIALSLETEMKDSLGQLFMSLELGSHWHGQFFTPYEVASLMARMTIGAITQQDIDDQGGFITVCEPAAGAGGMVIAVAHALKDVQLNYQRCLHVTAQDIEATAVHMAYLQLALLHIPAVVIHGDTLRLEEREYWVTPAHVLGGWDARLRARTARASAVPATGHQAPALPTLDEARTAIVADRVNASEQMKLF